MAIPVIAIYIRGGLLEGCNSLIGHPVQYVLIDHDNLKEEGRSEADIAAELRAGDHSAVFTSSDNVYGLDGLARLIEERAKLPKGEELID